MKIALLTRNQKLYSHQRIMETAVGRGHEIVPIDYLRCYMNITSRMPELRYMGEKLEGFDAVIPRIAASHSEEQVRTLGVRLFVMATIGRPQCTHVMAFPMSKPFR